MVLPSLWHFSKTDNFFMKKKKNCNKTQRKQERNQNWNLLNDLWVLFPLTTYSTWQWSSDVPGEMNAQWRKEELKKKFPSVILMSQYIYIVLLFCPGLVFGFWVLVSYLMWHFSCFVYLYTLCQRKNSHKRSLSNDL